MAGLFSFVLASIPTACIPHSWLHSLALQTEIFCTSTTCVGHITGSWRPGQHTIKHNQASQFALYHVLQTSQKVKVGMSWEQVFPVAAWSSHTTQSFSQAIHIPAVSCNFKVSTSCLKSQWFLKVWHLPCLWITCHLPNGLCKLYLHKIWPIRGLHLTLDRTWKQVICFFLLQSLLISYLMALLWSNTRVTYQVH